MESVKNAAAAVKETAANIAASATSGMEKTKAVTQEKVESTMAHEPMEKELATAKKNERIHDAEVNKQLAREQNAAIKQQSAAATTPGPTGTATYSTTGEMGESTGMHQMSAVPRHGTGQPNDMVIEGVATAHPNNTGIGGGASHNPRAGGTGPTFGTGGTYDHGTGGTA